MLRLGSIPFLIVAALAALGSIAVLIIGGRLSFDTTELLVSQWTILVLAVITSVPGVAMLTIDKLRNPYNYR